MIEITVTYDRGGLFTNGVTNVQIKTDKREDIDTNLECFIRNLIPIV